MTVLLDRNIEPCRFCGGTAVFHVALNRGTYQHPYDREQWLCAKHFYTVKPIDKMTIMSDDDD